MNSTTQSPSKPAGNDGLKPDHEWTSGPAEDRCRLSGNRSQHRSRRRAEPLSSLSKVEEQVARPGTIAKLKAGLDSGLRIEATERRRNRATVVEGRKEPWAADGPAHSAGFKEALAVGLKRSRRCHHRLSRGFTITRKDSQGEKANGNCDLQTKHPADSVPGPGNPALSMRRCPGCGNAESSEPSTPVSALSAEKDANLGGSVQMPSPGGPGI